LSIHPPPPLPTREEYGKMEQKYSEVVTARVYYVLRESLKSLFILIKSVDTATPFNVISQPRSLHGIEPVTLGKVPGA